MTMKQRAFRGTFVSFGVTKVCFPPSGTPPPSPGPATLPPPLPRSCKAWVKRMRQCAALCHVLRLWLVPRRRSGLRAVCHFAPVLSCCCGKDVVFGTQFRAKWDESFSANSECLRLDEDPKTGRVDRYQRMGTDKIPSLVRWSMSIPKEYTMRIVTQPLAEDGSMNEGLVYCCVAWDMDKNCADKSFEVCANVQGVCGTTEPIVFFRKKSYFSVLTLRQKTFFHSLVPYLWGF